MNNIDWLYSSQKVCIWFINPCLLYLKCVWHTFLFCLFKILLEYQQTDITDTLDLTQIHRMLIIIWRLQNHDKIESVNMIMKECWWRRRKSDFLCARRTWTQWPSNLALSPLVVLLQHQPSPITFHNLKQRITDISTCT